MTSITPDIERVLTSLAPESRRQRRSALLRPLNLSLIMVSLVGLAVMVMIGVTLWGYGIIGVSLLLNLVVAGLDRFGHSVLAANLFTIWVNSGTLLLCALNLFIVGNLAAGVVFASELALSVILAGLLLGGGYAFIFAIADSIALFVLLHQFFSGTGAAVGIVPLNEAASTGVPIAAFLLIVAVITWLYQRALDSSEARLSVARRQIMQDELLRRDLAIARELQQRLYPPPPLMNSCLRIASRSEPARETSGDFYDFIDLDNGQIGIVVADVTGKSIAAALMMALARSTLRSVARRHSGPIEVLRHANEAICRDHSAHQPITAFYGVLDTSALSLRFSNAGHPYPMLRRGDTIDEFEVGGLPLGALPDAAYFEATIQLRPGDQLFILSDGLVEERDGSRELFGYDRLCDAIHAAHPSDPERALDDLWRAVNGFRGETEQDDDITLVVIQVSEGA
jgi:serine phosphatase RsbU (regulator of sigma subunit)